MVQLSMLRWMLAWRKRRQSERKRSMLVQRQRYQLELAQVEC